MVLKAFAKQFTPPNTKIYPIVLAENVHPFQECPIKVSKYYNHGPNFLRMKGRP